MAANTCIKKLFPLVSQIKVVVDSNLSKDRTYWTKEDDSPVSEVDLEIQAAIVSIISFNYPLDNIIAEEAGISEGNADAHHSWVIDPIDGTGNFIRGQKEFGVSVGLMAGNVFTEALLIFPMLNEVFYAAAGEGTLRNGLPFYKIDCVEKKAVLCSKSYKGLTNKLMTAGYLVTCYNCATYSLFAILTGEGQFYLTINTMIYDVGPMSLICQEAGAHILDERKESLKYRPDKSVIPFFLAITHDQHIEEAYNLITS